MFKYLTVFVLVAFLISVQLPAQNLKSGFDATEFYQMLVLASRQADTSIEQTHTALPKGYRLHYRSEEGALKNRFDFFYVNETIAVVSIRGTVKSSESWLENFYSAMYPATGSVKLQDVKTFDYKLSVDTKAFVHIGWLIGLASIVPEVVAQINEAYSRGVRDIIITGHSQGGAIACLLRSYIEYNQTIPGDIRYKTYCSAAPKPGNLYYAYDFDHINDGGWAFRVVNAADWVPESPVSIQTVSDFNSANPFILIDDAISKQPLLPRIYLKRAYKRMVKANNKAIKRFENYLGYKLHTLVKKSMPGIQDFKYAGSFNYVAAGTPVVLMPDEFYYQSFPFDGKNVFVHHMFKPYTFLLKKQYKVN